MSSDQPDEDYLHLYIEGSQRKLLVKSTSTTQTHGDVTHYLSGEYVEDGMHHGRLVFKRAIWMHCEGRPEGTGYSFIYFWMGAAAWSWWIGDEVGGNRVWAVNWALTELPPTEGWWLCWGGEQVGVAWAQADLVTEHQMNASSFEGVD